MTQQTDEHRGCGCGCFWTASHRRQRAHAPIDASAGTNCRRLDRKPAAAWRKPDQQHHHHRSAADQRSRHPRAHNAPPPPPAWSVAAVCLLALLEQVKYRVGRVGKGGSLPGERLCSGFLSTGCSAGNAEAWAASSRVSASSAQRGKHRPPVCFPPSRYSNNQRKPPVSPPPNPPGPNAPQTPTKPPPRPRRHRPVPGRHRRHGQGPPLLLGEAARVRLPRSVVELDRHQVHRHGDGPCDDPPRVQPQQVRAGAGGAAVGLRSAGVCPGQRIHRWGSDRPGFAPTQAGGVCPGQRIHRALTRRDTACIAHAARTRCCWTSTPTPR